MKPLFLSLITSIILPFLADAMPTAEEIAAVKPLVAELMKPDMDAMKLGRKSKVDVAKSAMQLIAQADTPAAKMLLARGAFQNFVKGGDYEAAEKALDALLKAVPDYPADEQQELLEKALYPLPLKKAPQLRARLADIRQKASSAVQVRKIKAMLEKSPDDPALHLRLATAYALQDDWPNAVAAFAKSSDAALVQAAKAELDSTHPPAKTADLWWSVELPKSSARLASAIRSHAAALYTKALPSLSGLAKVQAERRIQEAESAADQSAVPVVVDNKKSAKSYVQNGLVAQWDGIENAGNGRHQSQCSEWFDLKGGKNISLTKAASFSDNALVCDGTGYAGVMKGSIPSSKIVTAEIVFEIVATHGNSCLFSTGEHKSFYDRCFGVVFGGTTLVFADYAIEKFTKGRHSCYMNFSNGEFCMDGRKGLSTTKGTLDASSARGDEFFIAGFRNSAIACNIHSIRFYSRKLTDEEVRKNLQIDKERFGF